jgi:hypothetical protein
LDSVVMGQVFFPRPTLSQSSAVRSVRGARRLQAKGLSPPRVYPRFAQTLKQWFRRSSRPAEKAKMAHGRRRQRLSLECLEERVLPVD